MIQNVAGKTKKKKKKEEEKRKKERKEEKGKCLVVIKAGFFFEEEGCIPIILKILCHLFQVLKQNKKCSEMNHHYCG